MTKRSLIIENATMLDVHRGEYQDDTHLLVENGKISEISTVPIKSSISERINLDGRYLLPGLIDCHVHVTASRVDLGASALLPDSYVTSLANSVMQESIQRGFTTLRDLGGADQGLVRSVEEGLVEGPRLIICGKALSQTGGHSDFRGRYDERDRNYYTRRLGSMGRICDGVDEMRRACREEIKAGATFVKLMANGGVASPTDPIAFLGFSNDEVAAAVEEAHNAKTYVAAHLYTDEAIRRAVNLGVRTVEHANLIEADTAELMAQKSAFACPTLAVYEALRREGARFGLSQDSLEKVEVVRTRGMEAVEIMKKAGVSIVFGTDLIGELRPFQSTGLALMAEVLSPIDVIRSATSVAAQLLKMEHQIGSIETGAWADLIALPNDPLKNLSAISKGAEAVDLVMKEGKVFRNTLN